MNKLFDFLYRCMTTNKSRTGSWLVLLRAGAGVLLIFKIISEWSCSKALYGSRGLVPPAVSAAIRHGHIPDLYSLFASLGHCCGEEMFIRGFLICLFIFAACLALGFMTRLSAFLCWSMFVVLLNGSQLTSYGFDSVLLSLLFYSLIFPSGRYYSVDNLIKPGRQAPDADMVAFYHGIVQAHLCIIYFVSGVTKIEAIGAWCGGSILWDVINQPQFSGPLTVWVRWLFTMGYFPHVAGIGMILAEVLYPLFIWVRGANVWILCCILLLHVLIILVMGLWLFGITMIVFNLVGFGHILLRKKPA